MASAFPIKDKSSSPIPTESLSDQSSSTARRTKKYCRFEDMSDTDAGPDPAWVRAAVVSDPRIARHLGRGSATTMEDLDAAPASSMGRRTETHWGFEDMSDTDAGPDPAWVRAAAVSDPRVARHLERGSATTMEDLDAAPASSMGRRAERYHRFEDMSDTDAGPDPAWVRAAAVSDPSVARHLERGSATTMEDLDAVLVDIMPQRVKLDLKKRPRFLGEINLTPRRLIALFLGIHPEAMLGIHPETVDDPDGPILKIAGQYPDEAILKRAYQYQRILEIAGIKKDTILANPLLGMRSWFGQNNSRNDAEVLEDKLVKKSIQAIQSLEQKNFDKESFEKKSKLPQFVRLIFEAPLLHDIARKILLNDALKPNSEDLKSINQWMVSSDRLLIDRILMQDPVIDLYGRKSHAFSVIDSLETKDAIYYAIAGGKLDVIKRVLDQYTEDLATWSDIHAIKSKLDEYKIGAVKLSDSDIGTVKRLLEQYQRSLPEASDSEIDRMKDWLEKCEMGLIRLSHIQIDSIKTILDQYQSAHSELSDEEIGQRTHNLSEWFYIATQFHQISVIELLLSYRELIKQVPPPLELEITRDNLKANSFFRAALDAAALNNELAIIKLLLEDEEASSKIPLRDHCCISILAARKGYLDIVQFVLIDNHALERIPPIGISVIFASAIRGGYFNIIKFFIDDPDYLALIPHEMYGRYLENCAAQGHFQIMTCLIETEAFFTHITDQHLIMAWAQAGKTKHLDICLFLLNHPIIFHRLSISPIMLPDSELPIINEICSALLVVATRQNHLYIVNQMLERPEFASRLTDNSIGKAVYSAGTNRNIAIRDLFLKNDALYRRIPAYYRNLLQLQRGFRAIWPFGQNKSE